MTSAWPASWTPEYSDRSSVVTMTLRTPLASRSATMLGTGLAPWMALAAGHRGVRVYQQLEGDVHVGGRAERIASCPEWA